MTDMRHAVSDPPRRRGQSGLVRSAEGGYHSPMNFNWTMACALAMAVLGLVFLAFEGTGSMLSYAELIFTIVLLGALLGLTIDLLSAALTRLRRRRAGPKSSPPET